MSPINPLPNYEDLGINRFMEKSIGSNLVGGGNSREINFDQIATTGSLGDKIQVGGGNIVIDGTNTKISMYDQGDEVVRIGKQ